MPKSGQIWEANFLAGHPLLRPFERIAGALRTGTFPSASDYTEVCERERIRRTPDLEPLTFVKMEKKPRRKRRSEVRLEGLYDGSIALRGEVFCLQDSYHDLLNALVFAAFPRSKRTLHARQFAALTGWVDVAAPRLPGKRTREQDALTIFDEGGVVLAMSEEAHDAWRNTRAQTQLVPDSNEVIAFLFGHALLEHLLEGQLAIRASALVCTVNTSLDGDELLDEVDRQLNARLEDRNEFSAPKADCVFEMKRDGQFYIGPPRF
jgi:hypothetical protein